MQQKRLLNPIRLDSDWLLFVLLSGAAILIWGTLRVGQGWGDDFASYIMQGESIIQGSIPEFLRQNRFTIQESSITLGPIAYPWGTPLLLSPILYFKGFDIQALKFLNIACFFGFLALIWYGLKKYLPSGWGLLYFSLFAFNPILINSLNDVISDIPFLFFSTLSMVLVHRMIVKREFLISQEVDRFILGLAISFATTIRTNGILLIGVWLLTQAVQNYQQQSLDTQNRGKIPRLTVAFPPDRRTFGIQILPMLSFILFSVAWMGIFPGGGSYSFSEFERLKLSTFIYHIYYYFYLPAEFLFPLNQSFLLIELFIFFTAWGIWRRYVQDYDFFIYCALSIMLWLIWPPLQGLRVIFALIPLLLYFFIWGIVDYTAEISQKSRHSLRLGMSILLVGVVLFFVTYLVSESIKNLGQGRNTVDGPYSKDAQEALTFISDKTNQSDIIVFFKPRAMRLFTDHPSVTLAYPKALELGDYMLIDINLPRDWNQVSPERALSLAAEGKIDLVFQNATYRLYHVNH